MRLQIYYVWFLMNMSGYKFYLCDVWNVEIKYPYAEENVFLTKKTKNKKQKTKPNKQTNKKTNKKKRKKKKNNQSNKQTRYTIKPWQK